MIIFYNKQTGLIEGTIGGRIHDELHLKMHVGDPQHTAKLVVQWKESKKDVKKVKTTEFKEVGLDVNGERVYKQIEKEVEVVNTEYEPDHNQPDLIREFEANPSKIYEYKVDLKTKKIVLK